MGLLFLHRIGPSSVHGTGLFSAVALEAGAILWRFEPGLEERCLLRDLPPGECRRLLHYGYVNPQHPEWLVICGDDARYWNFPPPGEPPNTRLGSLLHAGEPVVVAARSIAAGEELLIEPGSDADYHRKMGMRPHHRRRSGANLFGHFPLVLPVTGETAARHP
ncbi:MAG: hypothetical protein ER33_16085 [Cyanobium sp. CACIAM 14]|nr:MAG: hypothetical protein ER33_16085 [Cyanobium sp. CACIAM 14]